MLKLPPLPPDAQAKLDAMLASGQFQLPPPVFLDMEGDVRTIDLNQKTLTATFPVKARYQNPMGYMQGGMITAAIDNTIGPLSMLVAPPNVTKSIEVQFRRPVLPTLAAITIDVRLESSSTRELVFAATVMDDAKNVLATARATHVIVKGMALPDENDQP